MGHAALICATVLFLVVPGSRPLVQDGAFKAATTPGTIALLVGRVDQPDAQARVVAALTDGRADVRAVAARIVTVTRLVPGRDALRAAFAREGDPIAAAEQVRALMVLDEPVDAAMIETVRRAGWPAERTLIEMMARTGRGDLAAMLHVRSRAELLDSVTSMARAALLRESDRSLIRKLVAEEGDEAAWQQFWSAVSPEGLEPTPEDRAAYTAARREPPPTHTTAVRGPAITLRELQLPVAGLLAELQTLTGCRVKSRAFVLAEMQFHPTGRPRSIGFEKDAPLQGGCGELLRTAFALVVQAPAVRDSSENVLLPVDEHAAACLDTFPTASESVVLSSGVEGEMPRVVSQDAPRYPRKAVRDGREGSVLVAGTVLPSGCLANARVVRALHPLLDLEAVRTLLQWRFTPGQLAGRAVAVLVTIEVSFMLKQ